MVQLFRGSATPPKPEGKQGALEVMTVDCHWLFVQGTTGGMIFLVPMTTTTLASRNNALPLTCFVENEKDTQAGHLKERLMVKINLVCLDPSDSIGFYTATAVFYKEIQRGRALSRDVLRVTAAIVSCFNQNTPCTMANTR